MKLFSRCAPAQVASMMMGVWLMSGVVGNYLSGFMGSFWERVPKPTFWLVVGAVPLLAGFVVLGLRARLNRIFVQQDALKREGQTVARVPA